MPTDERLYHHGVMGMKWGVRKDGKPQGYQGGDGQKKRTYTDTQKKRDERVYNKRAVKRIQKRIDDGESVQSARHPEAVRRQRKESAKRVAKRAGKTAVAVGGSALAIAAITKFIQMQNSDKVKDPKFKTTIDVASNFVQAYLMRWANPFG